MFPRTNPVVGMVIAAILAIALTLVAPRPAAAVDMVDVTVTILTYQEISCPDGVLVPCPGDYYAKIQIGGHDFVTTPKGPVDTGVHSPYWKVTKPLDRDSSRFYNIRIEMWDDDEDDLNPDEKVDASPGDEILDIILDLETGNWIGEAGVNGTWASGSRDPAIRILFDISLSSTGDFDEDGIPDGVERFGVREVETGNVVANLANFGDVGTQPADPCRKTVLMELDYMAGAANGHTHRPQDAALQEIHDAFAGAPVDASAGCPYAGFGATDGVQLLMERGNTLTEQAVYDLDDLVTTRNNRTNFHPARRPYFHYAVFAHDLAAGSSTSGVCCRDGKDFLVTLGSWGTTCVGAGQDGASQTTPQNDDQPDGSGNIANGADRTCDTTANAVAPADDVQLLPVGDSTSHQAGTARNQASTIMHELGHSLGLEHRGRDDINLTPNYLSVMNYLFQPGLRLVAGGSVLDYSREALPTLDERTLDEGDGIGGPPQFTTLWFDPTATLRAALAGGQLYPDGNTGIDWDRDNAVEGSVDVDLNVDSRCIGPGADNTLDTTPVPDDAVANNFVVNGADDGCDTLAPSPPDDMQMAAGSGPLGSDLNTTCIGAGADEKVTTPKVGDDAAFADAINAGPNLICDTTAGPGDIQVVAVGRGETRTHPGWDDWENLRYRAVLSKDAAGAGAGHHGDFTYEALLHHTTLLDAVFDPDLEAAKAVDKIDATPGDQLGYTVRARNIGSGDAKDVRVRDTLPDGSVQERTPPIITSGTTATETFRYTVPCGTPDGTVLTNSVQLSARNLQSQPEANTANNTASATTTVHAPVLTVVKTATETVNAGEPITYTLTYANTGSGDASSVVITDTLPAGVYYSTALDLGAGPDPTSVTLNSDGTRTLRWNVGAVAATSGPFTIEFTARPTLLALGGTAFGNTASLTFTDRNGCTYPPVNASDATSISVVAPSENPLTLGYWRTHPEHWTGETLARIQATDQQFDGADGSTPNGALSSSELNAALAPAGAPQVILAQQLLATYFNLAERRINAGTLISSRLASRLGLSNVRGAALYGIATTSLPPSRNRSRYSDATVLLDEINNDKSTLYGP